MVRRQVFYIIGWLLIFLGFSMSFSLAWSLYYGEGDFIPILQALIAAVLFGSFLCLIFRNNEKVDLSTRDGFAIVTIGIIQIIVLYFLGSLPSFLSLPILQEWIFNVPTAAGARAVMIGIGLGVIATSFRIITGIERSYLGE